MTYSLAKHSDLVGDHWSLNQIELIRDQFASEADPGELALFLQVAKAKNLDPFSKQIHAVFRWDNRKQRKVMSIQTGIDGYRAIAARTGECVGNDDPVFLEDPRNPAHPVSATATVWKLIGGQRCAFSATARWSEYAQTGRGGDLQPMWKRMPRLMLGKCAEALALRKAFPLELSGVYTDEEMSQADVIEGHVVSSSPAHAPPQANDPDRGPGEGRGAPASRPPAPPPADELRGDELASELGEVRWLAEKIQHDEDRAKALGFLGTCERAGRVSRELLARFTAQLTQIREKEGAASAGAGAGDGFDYPQEDPAPQSDEPPKPVAP